MIQTRDVLFATAVRRRRTLVLAGCATYAIGCRGGQGVIICLCCGLGSYLPEDITQRYCGFCHEFHTERTVNERNHSV